MGAEMQQDEAKIETNKTAPRPHVVVVGAGFAGLAAVRGLRHVDADVTLIDRHNYHLFQPLLYQVATAALSPAQIAQPIRAIVRKQKNCTVALGEILGVDTARKTLRGHAGEVAYDYLVLATGATHAYFGHDDWAAVAPGLKTIDDATHIRRRVLAAFEQAEHCEDDYLRRALMTFVVVGAGPTGVEMAGAIAELARHTLRGEFRRIDPASARIMLVEAGSRVLAAFPEKLSARAQRDLQKIGVEVSTGKPVENCTAEYVTIAGQDIPCRTIIWAAGVQASPAAVWLGAEADRAGRVKVAADYSLPAQMDMPAQPDIFVVGDTAAMTDSAGRAVPGLAPAAMQAGNYVAGVIRARIENKPAPAAFTYRDLGTMATIGRGEAIALIRGFGFGGFMAWWVWGVIHIMPLVGFRNRVVVAIDWLWSYLTHARGARLMTAPKDKRADI
ncbi:MAG: NAD(P)/FAD-dependent oxidoreductase [Bdellovibrionales bacterium]|jgi:NADH dehydrogenase FAD-containing subunit|nr:NAD(P)/FAD-dependent oxidoreductase [Bdellovibrionales bacterium]